MEQHRKEKGLIFYSIFVSSILLSFILMSCGKETKPVRVEQMTIQKFVPFNQFLQEAQKAKFDDYKNRPGTLVKNEQEFTRMKQHILSLYNGVKVKNSFILGEVMFVDCIDINTQPGLKIGERNLKIEQPPSPHRFETDSAKTDRQGVPVQPMLNREKKDKFGNIMFCDSGFIPMKRVTLDELVRYETLDDFFNKYGKAGQTGMPEKR